MTDYEFLDSIGMCHRCRKQKQAPRRKYCFDCLDRIREENAMRYNPDKAKQYQARRREIYKEKKKAGICVRCNKTATHGLHCYEHHIQEKRKAINNAQRRKRERHDRGLIPEQRKKEHLCIYCGKPLEQTQIEKGYSMCSKCLSDRIRNLDSGRHKSHFRELEKNRIENVRIRRNGYEKM